ncbi:phosphatidylinositol-3,4,5-trisphosphate 3-phosphatase [Tritrichomonas foetus]|uniref:Phosphatidylinositol 3,4,5-trisphosphate 3-phosphatase and dual-specificity protein phosphatase PTEN n=1 Tax=Tritrichomonas foetus TaxID=1144522 RepID=A0A1J4L0N4_9EUKA|nr:phosphatidylinositol-3,4,5-trisphosphate 3-phosphatase [Tritrichomonas foetus]|eukprot:OHT16995.1 phosphatidylinositol-3,4,5-trisphosphate 3-phosphatase [Tritrichomonas foetus]
MMFRKLVSKDKIRYNDDKYDLDLALISQRIIAMGFPSTGFESSYRNPAKEVTKFLDENFEGHYKVYNLTETPYHESIFNGPVEDYPFPDHHAPPFNTLIKILNSIHEWLLEDPSNVIAVHCLAGMGRTGTVISCALMYEGIQKDAQTALSHFSYIRTGTGSGVKMPSQIRYVYYIERHLSYCKQNNIEPNTPPIQRNRKILKISITDPLNGQSYRPVLIIFDLSFDVIYNSSWFGEIKYQAGQDLEYNMSLTVCGDFTIKLFEAKSKSGLKEVLRSTHNSSFIEGNLLAYSSNELDGPHKGNKKYSPEIHFECVLEPLESLDNDQIPLCYSEIKRTRSILTQQRRHMQATPPAMPLSPNIDMIESINV